MRSTQKKTQLTEECISSAEQHETESLTVNGLNDTDTVHLPKLSTVISTMSTDQYKTKQNILVDTGASRNMISKSTLVEMYHSWENAQTHIQSDNRLFRSANNQINVSLGCITLNIHFNKLTYETTFSIMEHMPVSAILGNPFMLKYNAIINYRLKKIHLQHSNSKTKRSPIRFDLAATSLDVIQNPIVTLHATEDFTLHPMHEIRVWGDTPQNHPLSNVNLIFGSVSSHHPSDENTHTLDTTQISTATGITFL